VHPPDLVDTVGVTSATLESSPITLRPLAGYVHRWTLPGDPVDASARMWAFAGMGGDRGLNCGTPRTLTPLSDRSGHAASLWRSTRAE
jgi:hypothetical protein